MPRTSALGNAIRELDGRTRTQRKLVSGVKARIPKQRFADNEIVSGAVARRSGARLAALGGSVAGVDGADGYTGAEARLIREARARQKGTGLRVPRRPRSGGQYR